MTLALKKIASVVFLGALSTLAHAAGASALTTAPWQQNVYTNRFTIFCETAETVPGLSLQYGSGYGQSVEMTCVPGDSDGTTQHYIYKGRANLDSVSGVIGSLVSYRIVADGAVLKCPDGSDAAGSVWVWKDVPNERLTVALWSDNQVGAKVGDYDLDRFAYIKAAFGRMVAHDVDFGISTGDMTTSGSYADQTRPCVLDGSGILGRTRPYYVCFGNHDDYVAPDEMNKRYFETGSLDEPAYGTSERGAYYFYRGNVLFIFLHWPHDNQQGDYSVYRTWLQDLLATPRAKQAKFRLLFSHKPMFLEVWSEGSEGRNYDTSLYDTAVAGGVDMVVSGHMHGYERTVTDKGLVQLVNGGMGSLDHKEHVVNNYGDWTKMGGHRNIPYLWARQSAWKKPTLCGYFPVNMGCITSYCEMKIDGGELNVQAHGFCANGDYIGVFDDFTLVSKTDRTPPTPRRAVTAACADPSSFDTFVNTPVTNAKWKEYKDAVDEDFTYATADASKPVVNVSKDEITRFCAWLNNGASGVSYRLPTEAELRAKRTNLAGTVTEWTSTVDQETGWCRILGGNALASNTVWTASGDKPAIASSGCHANYLGFRLVKESGTEVVVTIRDWTGRKVQTVRGVTTTGTFALDVADYFNATVDYVTAFDDGTVSAAPSSDVVSGSVVTWTGVDRRLETEVFVQPRVPYKNFAQYNMGDPWIVKDPAANVWYVTSTMANDGLSVRQTTEFPTNRFGSSKTYRLKDHSEFGNYKYYIWAPEIHCIQGRWYAYLSASSNSGSSNYERPFVLQLPDGLTPYSTQWEFGAKLVTPGGDRWAIDGTILDDTANGGKLYYVWSGWPGTSNGTQNLYLAEMATPTSFASGAARIQISTPTESWETLTKSPCKVNEGPAVLRHGDAVHIVYSCNGCWTDDYSLALLTCTDGNFANPASWKKSSSRIFVSRPGAYGPGHCSFTRTADGQDMIVYHAKNVSGHSSDYYNYRDIRMQPIAWHGDTPVLGVPRPYDDTLTSDPLDLNADYYKEGPDVPPPEPETYDVTLETLLDEMCDADAATRLAALPWTGRLWSSYDRASVSPDDASTWYANNDRSQFVRTETRSGRTECVMVDAKGPGALTRLWTANGYGTVYRFYVDGASEPVVSGVGTNLVGGHVLCPAPLADEVSPLQPPAQRAQDLYLPITFAKSLVVTAELKDIPPDDDPGRTLRFWYNAEVRTYAEGTRVEPFSSAVLARAQDAIAAANAALRSPSAPVTDETQSLNGALAAGASRSVTFTRTGGAIRSFSLKLADGDEPLRTVRVKITFDGETTVDAAVGQLFGAGYAATPYATVNGGVAADGTLTFRQVMPFATSCTVTLENTGRSSCSVVASSVAVGDYDWDDARSLHFGALGFEERELPTRRGAAGYYDMTWVTLEGQGQLVGNTLMLDNSQSDQWWGEGDEKIYIDGETFPSYFGTGTEDFFGYAWGHGKAFTAHPFLALPLAGEGLTGGRRLVTTVRTRRLDVVPFATSLKLDVEIWHWEDCAMDYAPATFWYARPGVKVTPGGRGSEPEPPPVDPTAYGAADKKAATYTWKGGEGPWEYTTQWTPGASATYGIPSHKTYATANFPASLIEATTCTLSSDRSVKNALFDSPNLTFVIDNATLTVANVLSTDTWGAYNFGNTATGEPKLVFRGAAPGLYESTPNWRSNFGCLAGGATGLCTVRFEIPAGNWAAAPIRAAATESKVCFWENVKFEIDATALGVPAAGAPIVVPLAASSDGVKFYDRTTSDVNFDAVTNRSEIVCAAGATGRIVLSGNDLQLVVTAGAAPEPPEPTGTPVLTSPADFSSVPTLNAEVRGFNALSSDAKSDVLLKEADNAAYREQLSAAYKTGLPVVTLAWDGTEGRCGVKVWRECDGKPVLDTTSTTRTAVFWDAEIGRNYRWTVTCGGNSATGYFHTESEGPRLINEKYGKIANVRDLGGWATADGLVVRQGVLFRTGSFGALTGTGAPYFTGTLGIRQDVDLRPEQTIIAEDVTPYGGSVGVSPLGASVPRYCSDVAEGVAFLGNYADLFKNDTYKQAFWYNFVELNTETKLPAVFHCSAGRDRTGCLAYVIGAVLGVSADDLATDYYTSWASQGWIDRDTTAAHQAKWLPAFVNGLNAAYPPAQYPTLRQQAEKFLSDCCVKAGGTVAQAQAAIAALRARMLEIPEAPRTAGGKYAVPVPTIASKPANGSLQTADLVRSGFYKVTANAGGTEAGAYPVVLTLNDPENACWADGTVGATKTLTFTIRAGRIAGDRTWIGAAGDGRWLTAENWDPLESPAADEGATVTNMAGEIALDADVTLAKLKLGYDAAVRFVNAGGAARTFAVTAQSGSVLGQYRSTLEFSGAGMAATIGGGNNVWVKGTVVAADGAKLTLTGYDFDDNSGQVFRATGAGTVFNLDRTLTSNMNAGNYETRFEATDGATLQQSKSQKVPFASTDTSAPQHVYFTGDHGEWMGFSSVTFNGVGVVPHFDLTATTVQVGALSAHGDGVTATLKDGGAVKSASTLKFSNGGKTATVSVDGWGGIYTKASGAALYLGGTTAGKLTVNLRFAADAAERYAADSNLKAVFTTATAGTGAKIYLNSGVTFNVDVANFAAAGKGTWKLPLCYQAQTGDYGKKSLPTGDRLKVVNAGAQADRYTVACTAEGQYVYLTLTKAPGADPIPDEIANGKSGDPITIPPGAEVDLSDPKRLVVDGVAYDAKEHYVFARTEAGGVMLAIDPEEANITGISIDAEGTVTVTSGKSFSGFRYALEYVDALPFDSLPPQTELRPLDETRVLRTSSEGAAQRFYRLVVTDRDQ